MRVGFCVSGGGRIVEAILAAREERLLSLRDCLLFVDRASELHKLAHRYGIAFRALERGSLETTDAYRQVLGDALLKLPVDGLFLTFNWILPQSVISRFPSQIINLHMALLPLIKGRAGTRDSLASPMALAGITYHIVNEQMDDGPIIAQATTPLSPGMSKAELGRRQFLRALPLGIQVMRWMESDRLVPMQRHRVTIQGAIYDEGPFFPALDSDIKEFSDKYISQRFPDLLVMQ